MDYTLSVPKTGDSLLYQDPKTKYQDYELQIINKIILLISGYDTRPFFGTNVEENHIYPIGIFPDIITIPSTVNVPHISSGAIRSLLKDITHFGSAVHLLFKLQDALESSYLESKDPSLKPIPPSLIVLMLDKPTMVNGHIHGPKDSYDWYWKEDLRGFCKVLNILLDDWQFIMFRVQEKHFKNLYNQNRRPRSRVEVSRNVEEMKSPFMEVFESHNLSSEPKFGYGYSSESRFGDEFRVGNESQLILGKEIEIGIGNELELNLGDGNEPADKSLLISELESQVILKSRSEYGLGNGIGIINEPKIELPDELEFKLGYGSVLIDETGDKLGLELGDKLEFKLGYRSISLGESKGELVNNSLNELGISNEGNNNNNNRILNMYVNLESFVELMENLANLIELFLNYMNNKSLEKKEMSNTMVSLLLMKLRVSEMTNDRKLTRLWKYLLYYTFKDRKDYLITISTDNVFSIFEQLVEKTKEITENIRILDTFNEEKNMKLLYDDELSSNLFRICTIESQSIEIELISYMNSKFRWFINEGIKIIERILNEKYKYPHYLYLLNSIALSQLGENLFQKKTMAREKNVKSLLYQDVISYVKNHNSILSNLTPRELEGMLATIKIEMNSNDKYMISVVKRDNVKLFDNDTMKIYSEIFNHMTGFLNFKQIVEDQVIKYKWTSTRITSEQLVKILLLMTHIVDCLKTYYSMIIEYFIDKINKPKYGINIDEMKNNLINELIIIKGFLLVPTENKEDIYWNNELKNITELIRNIFQITHQFSTYSDSFNDFNDQVYNRLKNYFDEIILIMDKIFIDELSEYDKWSIFKLNRKCLKESNNEKETLYSILATFKNLLEFN